MTRGSNGLLTVPFGDLLDKAPVPIFVKDTDGRYIYVNRQDELETGISREDALGKTDFDLYPPRLAGVYRDTDVQTLERMAPLRFEEPVVLRGSERLFSVVKFPVLRNDEVVGVCGIAIDITEIARDDPMTITERQSRADVFFGRLLASLTPQEVRVLDLLATGLSDREIAEKLSLTNDTVRHHVSHLLRKLRRRRAKVIIEMLKRGGV